MPDQARKPHILTLVATIGRGGAETVALQLALHADPERFRRSVCVTRPVDKFWGFELAAERLREAGVDVYRLERSQTFDVRALGRLVRLLRSQRVDLVHAHMFGSNVWAASLGRAAGVPVIVSHEHTWSFEGQPVRKLIDRHVVGRYSDAVIAVSDADRERMIEIVGMPAEKVVRIHNGIDFSPGADQQALRRELGLEPDAQVIAQVTVLRAQKAIGVMLEAMVALRRTHPRARLVIAGTGDPTELKQRAVELGLTDIVAFLGPRGDVPDILAAAEVGVLSSDFEGTPLAVLEYMAAGLPVVATNVGGVPELIEDGQTGVLVPRRDPGALAAAVAGLLDDPQRARAMGEQGRMRQQAEFSRPTMVRRVGELYERLLASRGVITPA